MEHLSQEQYELIARHLSGEATPREEQLLLAWLGESGTNKAAYEEMALVWKATGSTRTFAPDVDKAWAKVRQKAQLPAQAAPAAPDFKVRPLFSPTGFMRVAAVLVPLLALAYLAKLLWFSSPEIVTLSAADHTQEFYLPDSSKVWLNKNTTLAYTTNFNEEVREVTLEGEAFFEVRRNEQKPFIVLGQHTKVQVLGTSFRVKTTEKGTVDEVEVVTGKVSVAPRSETKANARIVLLPGEKAEVLPVGTLQQKKADDSNSLAWKDEQLVFDNTPLTDVADALHSYFGVEVKLHTPDLQNCRFTGTFQKPQIEEVLQVLSAATGLSVQRQDSVYRLTGQGCTEL